MACNCAHCARILLVHLIVHQVIFQEMTIADGRTIECCPCVRASVFTRARDAHCAFEGVCLGHCD